MSNADVGLLRRKTRQDTIVQARTFLGSPGLSIYRSEGEQFGANECYTHPFFPRVYPDLSMYFNQVEIVTSSGASAFPEWDRGRLFDKDVMHLFLTQIKAASTAKCTSVASKEKAKQRPQALNTVELLRVASSALGISPHHTMQVGIGLNLVLLPSGRRNEFPVL